MPIVLLGNLDADRRSRSIVISGDSLTLEATPTSQNVRIDKYTLTRGVEMTVAIEKREHPLSDET